MGEQPDEYHYPDGAPRWDDGYLWREAERLLKRHARPGAKVFELGCGNGQSARRMRDLGYQVVAVDPSTSGVAAARSAHPDLEVHVAGTDDDCAARFGRFDAVVSLEVVEHCFSPKRYARAVRELLEPGGHAILSTPYHGYLKNLALALSGRMDTHFSALWEGGHIKFFSEGTLTRLLSDAGLEVLEMRRVGRIPPLAKSMVAVARRPVGDAGQAGHAGHAGQAGHAGDECT